MALCRLVKICERFVEACYLVNCLNAEKGGSQLPLNASVFYQSTRWYISVDRMFGISTAGKKAQISHKLQLAASTQLSRPTFRNKCFYN